jgi:hypothetical protein
MGGKGAAIDQRHLDGVPVSSAIHNPIRFWGSAPNGLESKEIRSM